MRFVEIRGYYCYLYRICIEKQNLKHNLDSDQLYIISAQWMFLVKFNAAFKNAAIIIIIVLMLI